MWISDITYLRTRQGWLYLCVVRDGCSRRVVGWAMDTTQTTDLVERALRMAHTPRAAVPEGLVFHADWGTQFTSDQLYNVCRDLGIDQCMGRTGVCFDNAMAESLWATLKNEYHHRLPGAPGYRHAAKSPGGSTSSTTGNDATPASQTDPPSTSKPHTTTPPQPPPKLLHQMSTICGQPRQGIFSLPA